MESSDDFAHKYIINKSSRVDLEVERDVMLCFFADGCLFMANRSIRLILIRSGLVCSFKVDVA